MASTLSHGVTFSAGTPCFRITSRNQFTTSSTLHVKVVNGQGALKSTNGARYNYPGVITVYLTENIDTCLAEKAFYFQQEYLQSLDGFHMRNPMGGVGPAPAIDAVLWRIEFAIDIHNIANLNAVSAGFFGVFPCMMTNPSQDYWHLKHRRANMQAVGYSGLFAPSSRSCAGGRLLVIFGDQSANVARIDPVEISMRLLSNPNPPPNPFLNHK